MKQLLIFLLTIVVSSFTFGQNYPHNRTVETPEYTHKGNTTVTGTMDVTGETTLAGKLDLDGAFEYPNISRTIWNAAGPVHVLTSGTDVACDDGDRHFTEIFVPYTTSATGIFYLVGSVGGTDSVVAELFDSAGDLVTGATTVASATAAGDIVGTAAQFQKVPFTGGAVTLNPGLYYMSVQFDGTTAKYRASLVTGAPFGAATESGTAWTPASITPDSTFTVSEGPLGGIY